MGEHLAGARRRPQTNGPARSRPFGWQLIGAFVAPTTTITAVLYYFGWVRASTFYDYFGVDASRTLGFSASDYIRNSATVVFTPLAVLLLASLAVVLGAKVADLYLSKAANARQLRYLTKGVQGMAAGTLVCSVALLEWPDLVGQVPLVKPTILATGALLALYATHLRFRVARRRPPGGQGADDIATALYRGLLGAIMFVALFWATSILAHDQGLQAAHSLEQNLATRTGIVLYAHDNEDITGRGVNLVVLDPSATATFRFRYTGLRLLNRAANGDYVLLPRGWTHDNGSPAYVLSPGAGIRVDLQGLPAD